MWGGGTRRGGGGSSSPDTSMDALFRSSQAVQNAPGTPTFDITIQRFTFQTMSAASSGQQQALATQLTPCDAIFIQSWYSNSANIFVNSPQTGVAAGITLSPGQAFVAEIENTRTVPQYLLAFFGYSLKRVVLNAADWNVSSQVAGQSFTAGIAYQSGEGF